MQIVPIEKPETLKESVYNQLENLLTTGQLERNEVYSANKFSDTLGVSRTPVREALMQLVSEGYLRAIDGRGFEVRSFSTQEIKDVFETRKLIETHIVRQILNQITLTDIQKLKSFVDAMEQSAQQNDPVKFLEADQNFHFQLIHSYPNHHIASIMNNIRNLISILGHQIVGLNDRFREVINEHKQIVAALEKKDSKLAVETMQNHLDVTEHYLLGGK
jgi:DNA-binding GntR family transcriptional regulator